jgi:hypothetical protein
MGKGRGVFDRIYGMNRIGQKTGQATECQSPFSAIALAADSAEAAMSPKTAVSILSKNVYPFDNKARRGGCTTTTQRHDAEYFFITKSTKAAKKGVVKWKNEEKVFDRIYGMGWILAFPHPVYPHLPAIALAADSAETAMSPKTAVAILFIPSKNA